MKVIEKKPLRPRGRNADKRQATKEAIRDVYANGPQKAVQIIPAKKDLIPEGEKKKLRVCAYCRVSTDEDNQASSYAQDFFAFNDSIKELLSRIYREGLQGCLYNAFYQVMMPQYGADPGECYEARFYSYGLFGFLDEWIKRGFYETPEQITRLFRNMMGGTREC